MTSRSDRRFDVFRALLVLIPCLFFLPELVGSSMFAGWDVTRLNLPLKWFDVQSIRQGVLPLWNHYLYAGMPQLAESESGLFYPGNWLLHLPGDFFHWANITYILHFILAGLFMDLWLRGRGVKPLPSFFGAILFQTAPFLLFHISSMALLQSVVWFPLLLWLADRYMAESDKHRSRFFLGFTGLLGGMLVLIGSAQMAFYQGFLLFWYLVGHWLSERDPRHIRFRKSVGILFFLIAGATLIGAVIWIPANEFAQGTVREVAGKAFYYLGSNWLTPSRLASAFYFPAYGAQTEVVGWASSLIYIGILPTILAILRLAGIRINWKKDAPLIVMGCVALFLAFGMNNPVSHLLIKFAPFSMFRYQGRLALGVLVALIALATHYFSDNGLRLDWKQLRWVLAVMIVSLAAFLLYATKSSAVIIGGGILIIDVILTLLLVSFAAKRPESRLYGWLAVYVLFHLVIVFPVGRLATMYRSNFNHAMGFFDLIQREDGHTPRLLVVDVGRFADRDLLDFNLWTPQTHLPNLCAGNTAVFADVQTMDPYTPLRPVGWHRLIRDEIGSGFAESENGILDDETAFMLDHLGIDAVVTSGNVMEIPGYDLTNEDMTDYFSPEARLFLARNESPRVWACGPAEPPKALIPGVNFSGDRLTAVVDMLDLSITIETSYDENWHATVDGEDVRVNPYLGVYCWFYTQTGPHSIDFWYDPESVVTGARTTLIGLVLFLIWLAFSFPRRRHDSPLPRSGL